MSELKLSDWEMKRYQDLVKMPSVTLEQQKQKMDMIDQWVQKIPGCALVETKAKEEGIDMIYKVDEGAKNERKEVINMRNIVVSKGLTDAPFQVLIPAHIDTVQNERDWMEAWPEQKYALWEDEKQKGLFRGPGAYDMQAGVMIGLELLKNLTVPKEICVYVAFTVDEEDRSRGIDALIEEPFFQKIDLVLSNEIGTESDGPGDGIEIIGGRCGIARFNLKATLDNCGHAATDKRDVIDEKDKLKDAIKDAALYGSHPVLGKEEYFNWREDSDERPGANIARWSSLGYKVFLTCNSVNETLRLHSKAAERVAIERNFSSRKIQQILSLNQNYHSYSPFFIDPDNPMAKLIREGVSAYQGKPAKYGFAPAWSDENVLYKNEEKKGKTTPTFSLSPRGKGAHSTDEQVWVTGPGGLADIRDCMHYLIANPLRQHAETLHSASMSVSMNVHDEHEVAREEDGKKEDSRILYAGTGINDRVELSVRQNLNDAIHDFIDKQWDSIFVKGTAIDDQVKEAVLVKCNEIAFNFVQWRDSSLVVDMLGFHKAVSSLLLVKKEEEESVSQSLFQHFQSHLDKCIEEVSILIARMLIEVKASEGKKNIDVIAEANQYAWECGEEDRDTLAYKMFEARKNEVISGCKRGAYCTFNIGFLRHELVDLLNERRTEFHRKQMEMELKEENKIGE